MASRALGSDRDDQRRGWRRADGCAAVPEINLLSGGASVVSQLATLATALYVSTNLTWLISTAVLTRVLTLLLLLHECRRHAIGREPLTTTRREIVALLAFGGWVTVSGSYRH